MPQIPIDPSLLSPAVREMFAKEILPFLEANLPADAETIEPTLILFWLLEEVQRSRAIIADLVAQVAAKPPAARSPLVRL